jgi:hypothetical protein
MLYPLSYGGVFAHRQERPIHRQPSIDGWRPLPPCAAGEEVWRLEGESFVRVRPLPARPAGEEVLWLAAVRSLANFFTWRTRRQGSAPISRPCV